VAERTRRLRLATHDEKTFMRIDWHCIYGGLERDMSDIWGSALVITVTIWFGQASTWIIRFRHWLHIY
jgi:hypothetical protein